MGNKKKKKFDPDQPMFYLDYHSNDDISKVVDYLRKKSGSFAIYFNGITVAFTNDKDRHAFVNGLECIYNILQSEV
jgi:hypothetical protein